ncbi:MAG: hypothetical protein IPG90_18270 [Bacteroidetes bacterium]|nr:hypothetical protein [Bacteroidota bacterium]
MMNQTTPNQHLTGGVRIQRGNNAGPYPHTYSSQAGCDSLVTINIDVNQTYSTSETHAICDGGSYPLPWGGTATSAGPYPHTYSSQAGCDSLVTINITVNQTYSTSETHAIVTVVRTIAQQPVRSNPHTYSSQAGIVW